MRSICLKYGLTIRNGKNQSLQHSIWVFVLIIVSLYFFISLYFNDQYAFDKNYNLQSVEDFLIGDISEELYIKNQSCSFWDCINLYRCNDGRLTIYVYPLYDFKSSENEKSIAPISREYYQIIKTIVQSEYYTPNPNEACLFLPSIDLLNQRGKNNSIINQILTSLNFWDNGENHIIFSMFPGNFQVWNGTPKIYMDRAIICGVFDSWNYRRGFDLSVPVWTSKLWNLKQIPNSINTPRKFFLLILEISDKYDNIFKEISKDFASKILMFKSVGGIRRKLKSQGFVYNYPQVLGKSTFCLYGNNADFLHTHLIEMLAYNCIPVLTFDDSIMPLEDVIDWSQATIRIHEADITLLIQKLSNISVTKIKEMQSYINWIYNKYFSSLKTIILSAINILELRIFQKTNSYQHFNYNGYKNIYNPLFLPVVTPKSQGFTAVILTYDRLPSLYSLIQKLSNVPSLQTILVIWNNQNKFPPKVSQFALTKKPLKFIQSLSNKLSNRFYPYPEITTEAILTIDDDIIMLTSDELEFGFEVWREFPDRIVGFPSRTHTWNNYSMKWQYQSEWTNEISMVLTGAAFHHKFWNQLYTFSMPDHIKEWVDEHMNCEDIAMNFLVSNITRNPPIKVTPRKKFKCPECTNTEMLSADMNHMRQRSDCINYFSSIYGRMPLRTIEFRADPVLYKDSFPDKLKRFNDIGNL